MGFLREYGNDIVACCEGAAAVLVGIVENLLKEPVILFFMSMDECINKLSPAHRYPSLSRGLLTHSSLWLEVRKSLREKRKKENEISAIRHPFGI